MKYWIIGALVAGSLLLMTTGCSEDSTDPEGNGAVTMKTDLINASVTSSIQKSGSAVQGGQAATEVKITEVRLLLSRLKFQKAEEDTSDGGHDVKTEPAVAYFTEDDADIVFTEPVPEGIYDRVKLEKHKISSSEVGDYINDPEIGPFVDPDRITLIIEGTVKYGDTEESFTFTDDRTENLWLEFDEPLDVDGDDDAEIVLVFDATEAFKDGNRVLDPLNNADKKQIEKNLRKTWRLQNSDD